jgi:molybdopterin converting factor subunit 1
MNVRLLTFAVLREALGFDERTLQLEGGTRVIDLWERLRREHRSLDRFPVPPLFAVNESYVSPETLLREGDELALIPPVSGG